ncbi:MAG: hypothetical protein ACRD4I_13940 [Candidatus Angelobacter sp.]
MLIRTIYDLGSEQLSIPPRSGVTNLHVQRTMRKMVYSTLLTVQQNYFSPVRQRWTCEVRGSPAFHDSA